MRENTTTTPRDTPRSTYRPEIEGLRTVAFLLVAIFHIWFNRVSGGVDVFFTVAGFLVTVSLLSQIRRFGHVRAGTFFGRLAMRLLPQSAVVLAAVIALTIAIRPYASWRDGFMQIFASATYWENWFLAFNSVDYLAVDTSRSPVQHFWAMSIQGQFYIIWFILFATITLLARAFAKNVKQIAIISIAVLVVVSFAWSVVHTNSNQQFAYFSTFTRVWEFGLGALLALTIDKLRIARNLSALLSWIALLVVGTVGILLPVADLFPGYIALLPVGAACLIILTGQQQAAWGASRILASKPLVWLGGLGYGVYLWHWPILVFLLETRDMKQAGWKTGIAIIFAALLLSFITKKLVEDPILKARGSTKSAHRRTALTVSLIATVLVGGIGLAGVTTVDYRANAEQRVVADLVQDPCFGAGALRVGAQCGDEYSDITLPADPQNDLAEIFQGECATPSNSSEIRPCTWGNPDSDTRIALIGNSHAAVWFPAIKHVAEQYGWRLDTYYREACVYNNVPRESAGKRGTIPQTTCTEWSNKLTDLLANKDPYKYIFTSALGLNSNYYNPSTGEEGFEVGVSGFHEVWSPLINRGSTILALRDYPRLDETATTCALKQFNTECAVEEQIALPLAENEVIAVAANSLKGAKVVDMSHWFCKENMCPTTIGNVRVYRDHAHFTGTYGETLGDPLLNELQKQAGFPPVTDGK